VDDLLAGEPRLLAGECPDHFQMTLVMLEERRIQVFEFVM
jgi:hypothetical protein